MEKILLEYDKRGHQKVETLLNGDLAKFQQLFDVVRLNFKEFDGTLGTIEDIIHNAPMFFLDQLVSEKDLNFNGLPISKAKALEMVEFPKEIKTIISAVKEFKSSYSNIHRIGDDSYDALSIDKIVVDKYKLAIDIDYLASLKDDFSVFTRNESQNKAVQAIKLIIDQIAVLKKLGLHSRDLTLESLGIDVRGEIPKLDRYKISRLK